MALWTIGDLHLSNSTDKPMDVFGDRWHDHDRKIEEYWKQNVKEDDTVVIPGDISWAINLEEVREDLMYLHFLPGRKILLKGNHDYWWETVTKMQRFLDESGIDDVFFLQNNHYLYDDFALCGTRGWALEGEDWQKMIARETQRLELSLMSAPSEKEKIVFLHYPPIYQDNVCAPMIDLMKKFDVKQCFYGHLHGISIKNAVIGENFGINFSIVSADALDFCLHNILK